MSVLAIQGVIYGTTRVIYDTGKDCGVAGEILIILSLSLKGICDTITYIIFVQAFKFFVYKKKLSRSKEALSFTPFNNFIVFSVYFMLVLRISGTIFNTLIGVASFIPRLYRDPGFSTFRVIFANIVYPIRDAIELLFFCYLFYVQSTKK